MREGKHTYFLKNDCVESTKMLVKSILPAVTVLSSLKYKESSKLSLVKEVQVSFPIIILIVAGIFERICERIYSDSSGELLVIRISGFVAIEVLLRWKNITLVLLHLRAPFVLKIFEVDSANRREIFIRNFDRLLRS